MQIELYLQIGRCRASVGGRGDRGAHQRNQDADYRRQSVSVTGILVL